MNLVGGIFQSFLVCILTVTERELVSKMINFLTVFYSSELNKFEDDNIFQKYILNKNNFQPVLSSFL